MGCAMAKIKRGWEFSQDFCDQLTALADEYGRPVTQAAIITSAVSFLAAMPRHVQENIIITGMVKGIDMRPVFPLLVEQLAKEVREQITPGEQSSASEASGEASGAEELRRIAARPQEPKRRKKGAS